ncbi:MAG: hypothetical protein OXC83_09315 [Chloroflexi bacterium]|nr:hypothetical protein [Chloroflexota bacterium]
MSSISEIQQAILVLSSTHFVQLRRWFSELDWQQWDSQIEADGKSGALGFLIAEADGMASQYSVEPDDQYRPGSVVK